MRPLALARSLGLSALLLALGACVNHPHNSTPVPAHDVEIVEYAWDLGPNAFSPAPITISLADQSVVTWYNGDVEIDPEYGGFSVPHHIKSDDGTSFNSGELEAGQTYQVTFTTPGTYTYHCEIHPTMTGTVVVNP
jgi:plastocyanin